MNTGKIILCVVLSANGSLNKSESGSSGKLTRSLSAGACFCIRFCFSVWGVDAALLEATACLEGVEKAASAAARIAGDCIGALRGDSTALAGVFIADCTGVVSGELCPVMAACRAAAAFCISCDLFGLCCLTSVGVCSVAAAPVDDPLETLEGEVGV